MRLKVLSFFIIIFICNFAWADTNTLILKSKDTEIDELGKVPARLKWDQVADAAYYYITISQQEDFYQGRVFKAEKNKMFLRVYPNTKYFWKIEPMTATNNTIPSEKHHKAETFLVKFNGVIPERNIAQEEAPLACEPVVRDPDSETKISTTDVYTYDSANPYSIWLATEAGYLNFEQTHSTLSSADSSGSMFPSIGVHFQTPNYWNAVSFKLFFQQIIGDFNNKQSAVTLINHDFQWVRYGASAFWDATTVSFLSRDLNIRPYLGVERQKTPYFTPLSPTSIAIEDMDLTNVIAGIRFELKNESRWSYIFDLSYGQTLSASTSDINVSDISGTNFEAQLGTQYSNPTSGFFLGGAFKGAMRSFEETVTTQSNTTSIGERSIDYFAIEGFAGFHF